MDHRSFGRRDVSPAATPQVVAVEAVVAACAASAPSISVKRVFTDTPSVDNELDVWKRERRFKVPWTQLCLMASICFGVASLVLPDDVNDAVNWLLYGLTAMSLYAWYTGRRTRAKTQDRGSEVRIYGGGVKP